MRISFLAAALIAAGLSAAHADPLCDSVDNAILLHTKAKPIQGTGTSVIFKLSHPAVTEMTLACPDTPGGRPALNLGYEGNPSPRFFALASIAGSLAAGVRVPAIAIADCIQAAKTDPSGEASRKAGKALIECDALGPEESGVRISEDQ
jgi:hypothetical protein